MPDINILASIILGVGMFFILSLIGVPEPFLLLISVFVALVAIWETKQ